MIQDAAAKCRFCGEWLDPSQRPAWALGPGSTDPQRTTLPAVTSSGYIVATPSVRTTASPTTLMGSAHPVASGAMPPSSAGIGPSWSRPAWMNQNEPPLVEALSHARGGYEPGRASNYAAAPSPYDIDPSSSPAAPIERATSEREHNPSHPRHQEVSPAPWTHAEDVTEPTQRSGVRVREREREREWDQEREPSRTTLDDVAERMQRIKASAAAVRRSVQASEHAAHERGRRAPVQDAEDDLDGSPLFDDAHSASRADPRTSARRAPEPESFDDDDDGDLEEERESDASRSRSQRRRAASAPRVRSAPTLAKSSPAARARPLDDDPNHPDLEDDDRDDERDDDFAENFGFEDERGFADEDDDDFGDLAPPPRPHRAWIPAVAVAAVAAGVGGYFLAPFLVSSAREPASEVIPAHEDEESDHASGEVRPGSVAVPTPRATDTLAAAPVPPPPAENAAEPETNENRSVTAALVQPDPSRPSKADEETQTRLDEARKLFERGGDARLDEAQAVLEGVLQKQPQLGEALMLLSVLDAERGDWTASRKTATQCTKAAPDEADCWLVLGAVGEEQSHDSALSEEDRALQRLGAIAAYEQYIELDPEGRFADGAKKAIRRLK